MKALKKIKAYERKELKEFFLEKMGEYMNPESLPHLQDQYDQIIMCESTNEYDYLANCLDSQIKAIIIEALVETMVKK